MVRVEYNREFEKQAAKLDSRLQKKLSTLLVLLAKNHYDSRLHTKSLSEPFLGVLSFRITRDWRVTFHLASPDTIRLLEVKHRKDIYR
ncbi:MAG: type II toxin-antitoxin system RelE/ParE family toxin [bacterium]|nr:type II toxin-antitoxin system RelE/ParE family toxin [bacterium]